MLQSLKPLEIYASRPFPVGYPVEDHLTFYSPEDRIPEALAYFLGSAEHSIALAMYGLDDERVAAILMKKLAEEHVFVQMTLDSSQAAGKHESALLSQMGINNNSIAFGDGGDVTIGQSEKHAIMHLKTIVVDSTYVWDGCTNLSKRGETLQDNQVTVTRHPIVAARARNKLDKIHAYQRTRMEERNKGAALKAMYDHLTSEQAA
jgi:phosphatidylserine/phosphatidylglycerophosphate/cardiolipin synthase-like enzyme